MQNRTLFTRTAWVGAERVRDIVNTYDPESYKLPYGLENDFFQIKWKVGEGITSFYNKKAEVEMCKSGLETFFTPVYERTEIRKGVYAERSLIGRNIRGLHAEQYQGDLTDVKILDHGPVFTKVELIFTLEGTYHSSVVMKMYRHLPKIEFSYRVTGQKIRRFWLILLTHRYFTWGRWNPTQSFCAITKRRIINGRFTAGL